MAICKFHKLVFLICLSLLSEEISAKKYVDPPPPYKMKYYKGCHFCSDTSKWEGCQEFSIPYPVLAYKDYADNIDKFIERYPTVTVETTGSVWSGATFGDPCRNNFGSNTFETINFIYGNFFYKYVCQAHQYNGNYDVGVEIGIGFKNTNQTLYIRPFVNGWMRSAGAYERCETLSFGVTEVTFNPRSEISVALV